MEELASNPFKNEAFKHFKASPLFAVQVHTYQVCGLFLGGGGTENLLLTRSFVINLPVDPLFKNKLGKKIKRKNIVTQTHGWFS